MTQETRIVTQSHAHSLLYPEPKELKPETIQALVNPKATPTEAMAFLAWSRANELDIFKGDAYLIKYFDNDKAQFVIHYRVFVARAEEHPDYRGFVKGIILFDGKELIYREGELLLKHERDDLVGAWCEVFRKGRERPIRTEVTLEEYIVRHKKDDNFGKYKAGDPAAKWAISPAMMIVKCAVSRAHQDAYPNQFRGLYTAEEFGADSDDLYRALQAGQATDPEPEKPEKKTIRIGGTSKRVLPAVKRNADTPPENSGTKKNENPPESTTEATPEEREEVSARVYDAEEVLSAAEQEAGPVGRAVIGEMCREVYKMSLETAQAEGKDLGKILDLIGGPDFAEAVAAKGE